MLNIKVSWRGWWKVGEGQVEVEVESSRLGTRMKWRARDARVTGSSLEKLCAPLLNFGESLGKVDNTSLSESETKVSRIEDEQE